MEASFDNVIDLMAGSDKLLLSKAREYRECYRGSGVGRMDTAQIGYIKGWLDGQKNANENTSDGYHSFKELYDFRKMYNAAFANLYAERFPDKVCKSLRHSDGQLCFGGGWFVVYIELPSGQITNHYEIKDFDLFKCKEVEKSPSYDGHTSKDVLNRLESYLNE